MIWLVAMATKLLKIENKLKKIISETMWLTKLSSSYFAVMSELGRFPYYIDIIKVSLKFWHRLENFDQNS